MARKMFQAKGVEVLNKIAVAKKGRAVKDRRKGCYDVDS